MTKKKKFTRERKTSSAQPLKHIDVSLDGTTVKMAIKLGGGDLSLGLRRAVVIASLRRSAASVSPRLARAPTRRKKKAL